MKYWGILTASGTTGTVALQVGGPEGRVRPSIGTVPARGTAQLHLVVDIPAQAKVGSDYYVTGYVSPSGARFDPYLSVSGQGKVVAPASP